MDEMSKREYQRLRSQVVSGIDQMLPEMDKFAEQFNVLVDKDECDWKESDFSLAKMAISAIAMLLYHRRGEIAAQEAELE